MPRSRLDQKGEVSAPPKKEFVARTFAVRLPLRLELMTDDNCGGSGKVHRRFAQFVIRNKAKGGLTRDSAANEHGDADDGEGQGGARAVGLPGKKGCGRLRAGILGHRPNSRI